VERAKKKIVVVVANELLAHPLHVVLEHIELRLRFLLLGLYVIDPGKLAAQHFQIAD
jgi:hypothetical protein